MDGGARDGSSYLSIKRRVPMRIRRRGVEASTRNQRRSESVLQNRSVVAEGGGTSTLLVRRSREWPIDGRDRQARRSRQAIRQPANTSGVSRPEMVERIVAGRQPPELTAQALGTGRFDIPLDWAAQKRALGFAQPV